MKSLLRWLGLQHWSDDTADEDVRRTEARSWRMGDTFVIGLPDPRHVGRAWFKSGKLKWSVEWGIGKVGYPGLSIGANIDGEDRDFQFHIRLPFLGYLFLTLDNIVPKSWIPTEHRKFTTWEPTVFPAGYKIQPGDRKPVEHEYDMGKDVALFGFRLNGDSISAEFMSVSEHMQSNGKRRWYCFWTDKVFGRAEYTREKVGPPVKARACFPEGEYILTLQKELATWKHPRWPWPFWSKSIDIDAEKGAGFQGKGENSWDCGPDAIMGMSSMGWNYYDAVGEYTKATLRERGRRGVLAPEHSTILTPVEEYC